MKRPANTGFFLELDDDIDCLLHSPLFEPNDLQSKLLGFSKSFKRQDHELLAPSYEMKIKTYPYRKSVLVDYGGDMTKRWYVEYYMWDQDEEKLKRHRNYKYFDKCKTVQDRYKVARKKMATIDSVIPFTASTKRPREATILPPNYMKILDACKQLIETKYPEKKNKKSYLTFNSICANFASFCAKRDKIYLTHITKGVAQEYLDYLAAGEKVGPNTIRNRHATLRAVFSGMEKREWIDKNPFRGLDLPKKKSSMANEALSQSEIEEIKNEVLASFPELWSVLQTLYYTFLRPAELSRLKIENVLLEQQKIYVPGNISKVDKNCYISIPPPLVKVFESMNLSVWPRGYYLFGSGCVPAQKPCAEDYYYKQHVKILNKLQIKKTLYSWKHTGVVEAYKNGVDIKSIQMQCRHSSIEQTDTYLKSLGFIDNENFRLGVKEI